MDKTRDVRREASRFKQSQKLVSEPEEEDSVYSEKSKKEKLRRLSSVGKSNGNSEMGCEASDREDDQLPSVGTSKRFKIQKKLFSDYNGVGHASVPRKLRSAMKKRSRDSISPPLTDLKRLARINSETYCTKMEGVKKSKPNMQQGGSDKSPKRSVSMPITKDEEEVAETLYALAGMFPDNSANDESKPKCKSAEAIPSDFPDLKDIDTPAFEDAKDKPSSSVERSAEHVNSLDEPSTRDQFNLLHSEKLPLASDDSFPQLNQHTLSSPAKIEQDGVMQKCNTAKLSTSSELHLDAGLKQSNKQDTSLLDLKGPPLLPGLPSTVLLKAEADAPILQSSTSKMPAWLDVASCSSKTNRVQNNSIGKWIIQVYNGRPFKRSAAHVYISSLIQDLQTKSKGMLSPQKNQKGPQEGLKHGVHLGTDNINGVKNGSNGAVSVGHTGDDIADKLSNGVANCSLQQRLHQDHPLSTLTSGGSNLQKQSFNFLSLSAGGGTGSGGIEVNETCSRARSGLEPFSSLQVPYLPSLMQQQSHMPFSFTPSHYNSSTQFPDHISSGNQVQLQQPSFLNTLYGPTQQQLWPAKYRPVDPSAAMVQFPNWQNLVQQETQRLQPHPQALFSPPSSSQQQQQQQQQLMATSSPFPAGRVAKQDHHLPSVYEESGGGFHAGGALPLQLLCNERLC
ncbi:hypothetical protein UlMin_034103 [Ulmus minor]